MDIKEYTEKLYEIEQKHDVNAFIFQDIELWPLFRYHILLQFRNKEAYFQFQHSRVKKSSFRKATAFFTDFFRKKRVRKLLSKLPSGIDGLLYSSPKKDIHLNDKRYNIFIDPILELLNQEGKETVKIELAWRNKLNLKEKITHEPEYVIEDDFFGLYFFQSQLNDSQLAALFNLIEKLESISGFQLSRTRFIRDFERIKHTYFLFKDVLINIKPKAVFFECYYNSAIFGLIKAAKELKIKTVDIQHGKQGAFHPMYSHWSKIPKNGYSLLPDFFWNWGEDSKMNIERHLHNAREQHWPIVGGNLWLMKNKKENVFQLTKEEIGFLKQLHSYKKVIMFSLQPKIEGPVISPIVIEAMQETKGKGYFWLFRKHPMQGEIDNLYSLEGLEDIFDIDIATKVPLFVLLKYIDKHITYWSSVCFEALEFGAPTTIIHPIGKKLYEQYISQNVFHYSDTLSSLLEFIEYEFQLKDIGYIQSDHKVAKAALHRIFASPTS